MVLAVGFTGVKKLPAFSGYRVVQHLLVTADGQEVSWIRDAVALTDGLGVEHVGIERGQVNVQRVFAVAFCNAVRAGLAFKP